MWSAKFMMIAFSNDAVLVYNDGPDKWIGLGHSQSLARQFKTAPHIHFILFPCQGNSFITIFKPCFKILPH